MCDRPAPRISQESIKNPPRAATEAGSVELGTSSYWAIAEESVLNDLEDSAHAEVLVADSRLDQSGVRLAVDAVFDANPTLGAVFEPVRDRWMSRPGGGWSWAVEPPGATIKEVIARQRGGYDKRTGRLFAVSMLPGIAGTPDRLVLTASHLCVDGESWTSVIESLMSEYDGGALAPDDQYRASNRGGRSWAWWWVHRLRRSPAGRAG
jgi:hypothetical protein